MLLLSNARAVWCVLCVLCAMNLLPQDPRGLAYEPYTLAPLAGTLTAVNLSGTNSLSLLLSLTECSSVRQLTLQRITGAAGTPELVVQVLRCMPVLQELHLEDIQSPVLERVSGLGGLGWACSWCSSVGGWSLPPRSMPCSSCAEGGTCAGTRRGEMSR